MFQDFFFHNFLVLDFFFYIFFFIKLQNENKKSIRAYEKKYLECQMLGRRVICPIGPANERITYTVDFGSFMQHAIRLEKIPDFYTNLNHIISIVLFPSDAVCIFF